MINNQIGANSVESRDIMKQNVDMDSQLNASHVTYMDIKKSIVLFTPSRKMAKKT